MVSTFPTDTELDCAERRHARRSARSCVREKR